MKTILVPSDYSNNAYSALFYVTKLFEKVHCRFIIVNSFENQVTNLTSRVDIGKTEAVVEELYEVNELKCEEVKHKIILDSNNSLHSYKTIATSLTLERAVNKLIRKEQVDFVVMGSKGSTGASDLFVGSTTLRMIRKIKNAPLLVIPQEIDFKPIYKIAFATGYKRSYSKKEVRPLSAIASTGKASIKVLHVHKKEKLSEDQRANFHQLFELLKENKPENHWLSNDSDSFDAITAYLHREQIDLLAMIYYKHNAFVRLFREQMVKKIAQHILIPFLIIPTID